MKNSVCAFTSRCGRCKNLSDWRSPKWPASCPSATGRERDVAGAGRFSKSCLRRPGRFRTLGQRLSTLVQSSRLRTRGLLGPMISLKKPSISWIPRNMRGCESNMCERAKVRRRPIKFWQNPQTGRPRRSMPPRVAMAIQWGSFGLYCSPQEGQFFPAVNYR